MFSPRGIIDLAAVLPEWSEGPHLYEKEVLPRDLRLAQEGSMGIRMICASCAFSWGCFFEDYSGKRESVILVKLS